MYIYNLHKLNFKCTIRIIIVIYITFVRTIYRYENRFFGTTDFAVASLEALIHSSHEVVAVVTNIDTFGGRGRKRNHKIGCESIFRRTSYSTLKPKSLKSSKFIATLAEYKADIFVVVAFRMLPEMVWSLPPKGTSMFMVLYCRHIVVQHQSIGRL